MTKETSLDSSMERNFNREIKRLALVFGASFLVIAVLLSAAFIYGFTLSQTRLARSYAQASRHSLILRDLRAGIGALQPSIGDGFVAIGVFDADGGFAVGLPYGAKFVEAYGAKWNLAVRVPIRASISDSNSPVIAELSFVYSLGPVVLIALAAVIILFLFFGFLFLRSRKRLREKYETALLKIQAEAAQSIAAQVSHDIRSPLSALNLMVASIDGISAEQRKMVVTAVQRINGIANDLLNKSKRAVPESPIRQINGKTLENMLTELVTEKKVEYRHREGVTILSESHLTSRTQVRIDAKELARAISNIINNAIEALPLNGGCVGVLISEDSRRVCISIFDNGKGIPSSILNDLGKFELSRDKRTGESGFGLGLVHARKTMSSIGGELKINSRLHEGTEVCLTIPVSRAFDSERALRRSIGKLVPLRAKSQSV